MSRAAIPESHHQHYGMWTETYEQLHAAALAGAPAAEIEWLAAAELDELLRLDHIEDTRRGGW